MLPNLPTDTPTVTTEPPSDYKPKAPEEEEYDPEYEEDGSGGSD